MSEQEISRWTEIVRQALQRYFDQKSHGQPSAVPGAPLKPLVLKLAAEQGLTYPPLEFQNKKFSDFLQALPEAIVTHRRLGQDLLVAPTGRFDLFDVPAEAASETQSVVFRPDVFKAFTKIHSEPNKKFWYSKIEGAFVERPSDTVDETLVSVDEGTLNNSFEERQAFVKELKLDPDTTSGLLSTLSDPTGALGRFSAKVKELHLERQWHQFRAKNVRRKLQEWAATNGITFNPGWLEQHKHVPLDTVSARETNAFLAGLMQLGPEDAKRVLVPLDIVLKVLRRE
ncbi:MAG: hypothetical protein WAW34_14365 [Rhodoferax sp.]